ncbi:hypothetical protein E2320_001648 [Naja naja]|nr:hypothetical protein E2320_001648 [Naja naja]
MAAERYELVTISAEKSFICSAAQEFLIGSSSQVSVFPGPPYGDEFHDDAQLVQFLGDNLEEEASNDEGAPELNMDDFLRELQSHFEDSSQEAEAETKSIRQNGRPLQGTSA